MVRYLIVLALLGLAHATKGACDTLAFKFDQSWFDELGADDYWDPNRSWVRKYARDADGELLRPLRPAFPLSSTALVSLTDGWHLLQEVQHGLTRLAFLLLRWPLLPHRFRRWWMGALLFAGLWLFQALAFHLTYTLLL
jgi:hypothetical protein